MKKVKAFTLIELLVVVVIIGILAALVMLSLNGAIKKSKEVRSKDSVKKTEAAFLLVLHEEGTFERTKMKSMCLNSGSGKDLLQAQLDQIRTNADNKVNLLTSIPLDALGDEIVFRCNQLDNYVIFGKSIYDQAMCWYASDKSTNVSDVKAGKTCAALKSIDLVTGVY